MLSRFRGGDRVAHARLLNFFDLRRDKSDFAGAKLGQMLNFRAHTANTVNQMLRAALHKFDLLSLGQHALDHAHEDDHA